MKDTSTDSFAGAECSIQASSIATEDAIWFGVVNNRMHLTRERVAELLPVLQHFVSTGDLPDLEGTKPRNATG